MSIADKLSTIANNMQEVYDAGFEKGKSFGGDPNAIISNWLGEWQTIRNNNYAYAFYYWKIDWLKLLPNKTFNKWNGSVGYAFAQIKDIIDLTQFFEDNGFIFDTSTLTSSPNTMFHYSNFTRLPVLNISKTKSGTQMVMNCSYLETIDGFIMAEDGNQTATAGNYGYIQGCPILKNIIFGGALPNNFRVMSCPMLSQQSILSFLQACKANDGKSRTVTLPNKCIDGTIDTLTTIQNDTELNSAYTTALSNGYTIAFNT